VVTDLRDQLADFEATGRRLRNRLYDYADFDTVIVDRLVAGLRPGALITAADAGEATRRLAHLGYSDRQTAHRLGFTRRAVIRIRQRLSIPPALHPGANQHTRPRDAPARPKARG
jgi:hypothetical protein